jgi:hypothetical protein
MEEEKVHKLFSAFWRRDVKHYKRWQLYPGAMLMPIRFVLIYTALFQATIISYITRFLHGDPADNGPLIKGTMLKII